MNRLFIAPALCLILGATATLHAQQFDQVVPLKGSITSGVITGETVSHVQIEVRGAKLEIPVNEIKRVTFGEDPTEFKRGRDAILNGNYEAGLDDLKKVDPASLKRSFIKQDYQFYGALAMGRLALTGGGDKAAAKTAMMNFAGANRASYHFYEAAELLGDLAVSQGDYASAARYYGAITKAPFSDYQMRGGVLEGRALVAQKNYTEAQAKFEAVMATNDDSPTATGLKRVAVVGKAVCLAEQGQHEPAITVLNQIIAENDPLAEKELFGRAYNALGLCHLKANRKKDALLAFLHVDLLFDGNSEVHAEALYYLSKLWSDANQADRAVSARNLLTTRYAGSPWAKLN